MLRHKNWFQWYDFVYDAIKLDFFYEIIWQLHVKGRFVFSLIAENNEL